MKALLILPGDQDATEVVDLPAKNRGDTMRKLLGCQRLERIPKLNQLKQIDTKSGDSIEYEMWVDEEGGPMCNNREYNACGTITSHPLGESLGLLIYGPCIVIRTNKSKSLSLGDWGAICDALWYDEDLVEANFENHSHIRFGDIVRQFGFVPPANKTVSAGASEE
jgi:hypothetical protein